MATNLSTGAVVAISAGLPTTFDDSPTTGYPSLTFTAIGEVIDISEVGITFNVVEHQAVAKRFPTKKKGNYNHDDVTITAALDEADAGQVIVAAALAADASYSFRIVGTDANTRAFTGKVVSAKPGPWAGDDTITRSITISVNPETGVTYATPA